MTTPIGSIKAQYFLAFAPLGSLGPLLPIFLKDGKGFTDWQFGMLVAATAISMVITPVILALLADTRLDTRRLLAGSYVVCAIALIGIYFAEGVVLVSIIYGIYTLAFVPTLPLTDALYFSVERNAAREGIKVSPYQFVRIWGTYGFILPSCVLYFLINRGEGVDSITWVASFLCLVAAANSFRLPLARSVEDKVKGATGLPTANALRTLFGPGTRIFCFAMFLAFMSAVTYYNYFPNYLRDVGGIPEHSIGLVMNVGVVIEIFFILGFGPLRRRFRLKGVLLLGLSAMFIRMSSLALFPSAWTGILVQSMHGFETLALYIVPMIYIDRLAGDDFRSSIQGAYMMTVLACSKMLGALVAGAVGGGSLFGGNVIAAFQWGAVLSLTAVLVVAFLFKPIEVRE